MSGATWSDISETWRSAGAPTRIVATLLQTLSASAATKKRVSTKKGNDHKTKNKAQKAKPKD